MVNQNQNDTSSDGHAILPIESSLQNAGTDNTLVADTKEIALSIATKWSYADSDKATQDELASLFNDLQVQGFSPDQLRLVVDHVKELHKQGMTPTQIGQLLKAQEQPNKSANFPNKMKSDLIGTTLGNFQIFEFLAKGGMSEVYKAVEKGTDKIVACKFLLPTLSDVDSSYERFKTETKALQKISSPHSVKVFDSGQLEGQPYMILEFIRGKPLNKVI